MTTCGYRTEITMPSLAELCSPFEDPIRHQIPCYYKEVKPIGRGTFGLVLQAVDVRSGQPPCSKRAIKLLPRGGFIRGYKTQVKREIVHQGSLKHPLIVKLHEVFLTSDYIGIVMDFAAGGDLLRYLYSMPGNRVPEPQARWLFQQLAIALEFCHNRGIANRDVKLENILVDDKNSPMPLIKICDFGYSKHDLNSSAKSSVGTCMYMPPEVLLGGEAYDAKKVDVWATGIILYAILCGVYPFDLKDSNFIKKMATGDFSYPANIEISEGCKELVTSLLAPNPNDRPHMANILKHPWVTAAVPDGAMEMNAALITQQPDCLDLPIKIDELVEMATQPGNPGDQVINFHV